MSRMAVVKSPSLLVLYGSETGTAQCVAEKLWRDTRARRLPCRVTSFDEYNIECLRDESIVVFVVATCGDGDAPANMRANWRRLLVRGLSADYLTRVYMAIIGLGDSSYDKYNFAAKRLHRRVTQLGARVLLEPIYADDRHPLGVWGAVATWCNIFWLALETTKLFPNFDVSASVSKSFRIYKSKRFKQSELSDMTIADGSHNELEKQQKEFSQKNPFRAQILVNRELHTKPASERSCRHVEFLLEEKKSILTDSIESTSTFDSKIENGKLSLQTLGISDSCMASSSSLLDYAPGDHVGIFPANEIRLINKLERLLGVDFDTVFEMVDVDDASSWNLNYETRRPFPCPCTYRTAFTHYTDISTPTRADVLGILADYTDDAMQREKLEIFASTTNEEHIDEYLTFVHRARRNIVDILEQFNTCQPPIDLLLEILPRLQPRFYSISSSLNRELCVRLNGCGHRIVALTSLVINYRIGIRSLQGVCTNYLAEKKVGEHCEIFIRRGVFRLSNDPNKPIIMIGPGTGFAPFRGFLYERYWLREEYNTPIGPMILYFGCRQPNEDYIYRDELEMLKSVGVLTELHTAFSRTQSKKIYVQDLLWENRVNVWRMLHDNAAFVYICGDAKNMAKDVRSTFLRIFQDVGAMADEKHAERFLANLQKQNRYQTDVWH